MVGGQAIAAGMALGLLAVIVNDTLAWHRPRSSEINQIN